MEAENVLADDVGNRLRRLPELVVQRGCALFGRSAERADVVGQGIEPDVHDVLRVARNRDAPAEAGTRDGQIPKTFFDERLHLVES
jgi:hypothetical protein